MDSGMKELCVKGLMLVFEAQILLSVFAFEGNYA